MRLHGRGRSAAGVEAAGWQFLASIAAGASIWATHFIAIIAYQPGTPVSFDPVLTIVSLLVALVGSFCGFTVAGLVPRAWAPAVGGAMVGLSIAIMHYTGMLAYLAQGVVIWDKGYMIASVAVAVIVTSLALHVASRTYAFDGKLVGAALLTLSIISLHFTGMTAFKLVPLEVNLRYANPAAMEAMALAVALVSLMIVGAVLASYLIDSQTRTQSLSQLRRLALSDTLTTLANRAAYNDYLDLQIQAADESGVRFALVTIDLDRFKEINDLRGHAAGDETLRILSRRMQAFAVASTFIARIGGDEFAIIMPVRDIDSLRRSLTLLRDALVSPFAFNDVDLSVGASFGVCIYPDDARQKEALINNADLALYRAKAEVTEKICFFDNVMDQAARSRRALAADLRLAIEADQLEVFYQVQTAVVGGAINGYEALLRWRHPERGYIPPSEFIPLAEDNGLILPLGEWALRTACRQYAEIGRGVRLAVNLSPLQFLHPNLPGLVADVLADTGMKAENLELELTESAIIQDKERTLAQLEAIRKLGVTIALDDFGTGYSSLDTLRSFPFDKIKLDRTFMHEVETSNQARAIIRAVLALGKSLDIPVLAEGIETAAQLEILHREGCDSAQGYYLGRPMPLPLIQAAAKQAGSGTAGAAFGRAPGAPAAA
jgi:diguanylate cyclase (GGDEF)-like protein